MQTAIKLKANIRDASTKGALNSLRRNGRVPAIIYGLNQPPKAIEFSFNDFLPITRLPNKNSPLEIEVDGGTEQVIMRQIDRDPIKGTVMHVDLLRVTDQAAVIVKVPVRTEGIPYGVKTEGGVFSVMKKWVKLRAKVADIPESFVLDISELRAGVTFYVKDLQFDKGRFVTPPKTALYGISPVRVGAGAEAA